MAETAGLSAARLREIAARIDLLNNTEYLMSADGKHYLLPEARTACDILAADDGPALLAEVRRLRTVLGNLLALAPECDHYVSEAGCESWASDEYEAARREARAALDGTP